MATYQEWSKVIAKAWLDEDFKELLEREPAAAFKQCGIDPGIIISVPPRPSECNDEQINAIMNNGEIKAEFLTCLCLC